MSPPSRVVVVALIFVGVVAVVSVPAAGLPSENTVHTQEESTQFGENPEVSFDAELQANGDAQWNITTVVAIDSEFDAEAYRSTAEDFEDGELPALGYGAFETGLAGVNDKTDREMDLTNFRRDTSTESEIEKGVGRFSVEFTWENFTRKQENRLLIDREVLVMENGGLWFPRLSSSQTLNITAPPGYGVRDASVGAENGQLQWRGPVTFDESSLQVTFLGTGGSNDPDNPNQEGQNNRSSVFLWLLPIVALGIAVAVLLTRVDQVELDLPSGLDVTGELSTSGSGSAPDQESATVESESPTQSATDQSEDTAEADDEVDTELLSDEERVERLLSSNGGRMKQADIVKETDWSNAKVSQLLSSMEEDGQIDKLRIGRENLISFPEEAITDSEE
jgi:hypothetical protein